jgi:ribosomal protein L37E
VEVIHLTDTSHSLEHDQVQEREQTLRRRLWEKYAVKFPERAERLRNSSGRFPERLFQISAFKARTESIKTMVWRSKHNQPLNQNPQESEISPTCRRCGQSNETMTHLFEDCPHPESLKARSRALQKLFEEAQIEPRTWEDIVTRKADPAVTTLLEKVIHDFVHTLLNE